MPNSETMQQSSRKDSFFRKSTVDDNAVRREKSSPIYSLLGGQKVGQIPIDEHKEIDEAELSGFRRAVAGVEWLLLVLVLLCMKLPGLVVAETTSLVAIVVSFAVFTGFVHYIWRSHDGKRWKLALNTWVMIVFITAVVWQTGALASPLLPLYFIVIMLSAVTIGMLTTMLEAVLITACYVLLATAGMDSFDDNLNSIFNADLSGPVIQLFLLWFIAYFVSLIFKETEKAKEKIRQLSRTDQLTGLWNMKMLLVFMQREYQRTLTRNGKFSVLMIDADNLKAVNDIHGHDAGTMLIVSISETMRTVLREEDMLARFGGDEFVAFLPDTSCHQALEIAERMRRNIAKAPLDYDGHPVRITVSCGIACFPDHGQELATIMKMADKALYTSKDLGKNRCTIFEKRDEHRLSGLPPV
ncbi:MAG: GGDEF domain-containing protein [Desulfobulbaceae bacterium]|nr:GGDEF domain-containing protein [Desulfobulbaceae bacterium]